MGGECQDIPSKISCLTVPKNFVGQPFRVSLVSSIKNFYASEGYVTIFCRNFLSHSAEKFRRGTLLCCVSENFGYRKNLCFRGLCHDFPSKIFCLTVPKNFAGEPFSAVLQKFLVAKKFMDNGGEYQEFPSKIFCLTVPEISVGESFTVALISGTEKVWIRGGGGEGG